jgi:catechol 2,3-dioxygenase-like lactoylglutathione lyase family enzyme
MLDHVGLEVTDLERSARFYDALFSRLGIRRVHDAPSAVAYGRHEPRFWIVARGRAAAPGFGHVAVQASGRVAVDAAYEAAKQAGGQDDGENGPPALRPQYGPRYYAAYLLDPDGLRIEVVAGGH